MSGLLLLVALLALFVGIQVASAVPTSRHLPMLAGANVVHGVVLVGAVIVTGRTDGGPALVVGLLATVLATVNLVGGFIVTDRVLVTARDRRTPAGPQ